SGSAQRLHRYQRRTNRSCSRRTPLNPSRQTSAVVPASLASVGRCSSATFANMARKVRLVVAGRRLADGASTVDPQFPPRWEYTEDVAHLWLSGPDRPFAQYPDVACRERPGVYRSDSFGLAALCGFPGRTGL